MTTWTEKLRSFLASKQEQAALENQAERQRILDLEIESRRREQERLNNLEAESMWSAEVQTYLSHHFTSIEPEVRGYLKDVAKEIWGGGNTSVVSNIDAEYYRYVALRLVDQTRPREEFVEEQSHSGWGHYGSSTSIVPAHLDTVVYRRTIAVGVGFDTVHGSSAVFATDRYFDNGAIFHPTFKGSIELNYKPDLKPEILSSIEEVDVKAVQDRILSLADQKPQRVAISTRPAKSRRYR